MGRAILGFVIGVISIGLLLFLISIRSPVTGTIAQNGDSDWRTKIVSEEDSEQKKNN